MRIISGELKGRRLQTPGDNEPIRPTTDRVKEAVFSMAAPYLDGSIAVDLFTGTGNLGLEAISRGAKHVYFADKSRRSLTLTEKNIRHCEVWNRSTLLQGDWEQVLKRLKEPVDVFFLDPPYGATFLVNCIERISDLELLASQGIIVVEHSAKDQLPEMIGTYQLEKQKRYGGIAISIYSEKSEEQ